VARRKLLFTSLAAAALSLTGCGAVGYTVGVLDATQAVEEARQAGADRTAPYYYYYASAYLAKAREEAGEAEYQHAMESAEVAHRYGVLARDQARRRGHESGR
jgi:hypothetical protein